jgi:hypothetical protein
MICGKIESCGVILFLGVRHAEVLFIGFVERVNDAAEERASRREAADALV